MTTQDATDRWAAELRLECYRIALARSSRHSDVVGKARQIWQFVSGKDDDTDWSQLATLPK